MIVTSRVINAPPAAVDAVLEDPTTYPSWLGGARRIRSVDRGWPQVGRGFDHEVGAGPVEVHDRTVVTGRRPGRELRLLARARPLLVAEVRFELAPIEGATRLEMTETPLGAYRARRLAHRPVRPAAQRPLAAATRGVRRDGWRGMSESCVDAIVVGAGPNGLVAANILVDAGWSVTVYEAAPSPGGAVRTEELTAPGFRNDTFSAFYPLAAASPVIDKLGLEDEGLQWTEAPAVLAHPRVGHDAVVLERDAAATAARLESDAPGDGRAYLDVVERWRASARADGRTAVAVPAGSRGAQARAGGVDGRPPRTGAPRRGAGAP